MFATDIDLAILVTDQLGDFAWEKISAGDPQVFDGYLYWTMYGQRCAWGINTDLFLLLDEDMEFPSFEQLFLVAYLPF